MCHPFSFVASLKARVPLQATLKGNNAVIVGGASGIGLAIGRQYHEAGANVALWDVSEGVAEQANELGGEARGAVVDATDELAVKAAFEQLSFSSVDHVVYAAGCGSGKYGFPFWSLEPADWHRVWQVNVMGAVHVLHAAASRLVDSACPNASVLLLSSIAGQIGSQTDPPYSAAKAAILNLMQCAAKDFAEFGVRVNAICPGMVKTPLNRSVWQAWAKKEAAKKEAAKKEAAEKDGMEQSQGPVGYEEWAADKIKRVSPLGRWQTPEDMAAMATFLASPLAINITGQTLNIDGGQVMH